jgi:hypothetical protein
VLLSLPLAKSLAEFRKTQAKTKIVCSQHTKHGTAEPFHFINMGPMNYGTMLRRLCVTCHCRRQKVWQISARAKPIARLFAVSTPSMEWLKPFHFLHMGPMSDVVCSQHTNHGNTGPFHFIKMGPMSYGTMLRRLCVSDFGHVMCSCHCRLPLLSQISARAKPNQDCLQPAHQAWHC